MRSSDSHAQDQVQDPHEESQEQAPLIELLDYESFSDHMNGFTRASINLIDATKRLSQNLITAINLYISKSSPTYTSLSNLLFKIDRGVNVEYLGRNLTLFKNRPAQNGFFNPLSLALWVYIYVTSSDFKVRFTNKSRLRSYIYAVLEDIYPLSILKSLSESVESLILERDLFLNDLMIESSNLQNLASSLELKVLILVQVIEDLVHEIEALEKNNNPLPTTAMIPSNNSDSPNSQKIQKLKKQKDDLNAQLSEIKEIGESQEKRLEKKARNQKKDTQTKQLLMQRFMRNTPALSLHFIQHRSSHPVSNNAEQKRSEATSIEIGQLPRLQ